LDKVSQAQLDRAYRLTERRKQGLNSPLPAEGRVVSIYAGTRGYLDSIPVGDVKRYETELLEFFRTQQSSMLTDIRSSGAIADADAFDAAVKSFGERFQATATDAAE